MITSRIGNAFVYEYWLYQKANTAVQYLNHASSDHNPLVCQLAYLDSGLRMPFKFLNYLAKHKDL